MTKTTSSSRRETVTRHPIRQGSPSIRCLITLLALTLLAVACGAPSSPPIGVKVQTVLPTPTLEPTFTPSPPPTNIPQPSPTATVAEPTPTPTPQSRLSGRILDQDTNQPVAGATVRVGTASATTDAEGRYALSGSPPGQYVLSVTHPDYDPGLSSIFTLAAGQELSLDLALYAPDNSPYPKDPMLTNPLDPNGAPTAEDAERLAHEQGLTGEVVGIRETNLSGEYLVNYKIGDEVRAAIAELKHEVWELADDTGRAWWIIKVCGNLASPLPPEGGIATPQPRSLPPMAEVVTDRLIARECASETCAEVGTVQRGTQVEVIGCLADGSWCQVSIPGGGSGWCTGWSLRQLAVAEAVPLVEAPQPEPAPSVDAGGLIAFVSTQHSPSTDIWQAPTDIYVMNPDGSEQRRLNVNLDRHTPTGYFQYLKWLSQQELVFGAASINYVLDLGSGRLNAWDVPYALFDISDFGHKIAYIPRGTLTDIYVANVDGSNPLKVTDSAIRTSVFGQDWLTLGFAISPDGQQVVFGGGGGQESIGIINTDGSGARVLVTVEGLGLNDHYDWSPDGRRIVFESATSGSGPRGVLTVNADGSDLKLLFETMDMSMPVWSPDGQKIAFVHKSQIWVMDADGKNVTQLTNAGFNCCPAWSR